MFESKKVLLYNKISDKNLVGNKFFSQHIMYKKGLPIPPFYCLSTHFYIEVFDSIKRQVEKIISGIDFDNSQSILENSRAIEQLFLSLQLSDKNTKLIYKYFNALFSNTAYVSVRASMIGITEGESEDSKDNPFAGISTTYLYVNKEQLLERIKGCWASGFSQEALLYRKKCNIGLMDFSVAVGIQDMIFGNRSFVMFTCDPIVSSKDTVIAAGFGIGEGIVQEKVEVDHYFVNFLSNNIEKQVSSKTKMLTYNGEKGWGICEKEVDKSLKDIPCLNDDQITQLKNIGKKIESIFKCPQDIEGTFTDDNKLYILQARPVAIKFDKQMIWTNTNITESFPGVNKPLTYSIARLLYRTVFYDGYRKMGYKYSLLQDNFQNIDKMIGFHGGRIYYSLNSFYHLHSLGPLFPLVRADWEKIMGFQTSYKTSTESPSKRLWTSIKYVFNVLTSVFINIKLFIFQKHNILKFNNWWEELFKPLRGKSFEDMDMLLSEKLFSNIWNEAEHHWGITIVNDTYLPILHGMAHKYFQKEGFLDENPGLLNDLLCGDEQLLSVKIMMEAIKISEKIHQDKQLLKLFNTESAKELWKLIESEKIDKNLCDDFKNYVQNYGDRVLMELKMDQANFRQEPWAFIDMIKGFLKRGLTADGFIQNEKKVRAEAEKRLKTLLHGKPLKRMYISIILKYTRWLINNRENARYYRSELFGFSRNIFIGIGHQLQKRHVLNSWEDILYLTLDEIFGYIDGTGVTENLQALSDIRKKEFIENSKLETAVQITTYGPVRDNSITDYTKIDNSINSISGIGSCPGKITGKAKVILNPNDYGDIDEDMILVTRETDPGWLFLMLAAKGIIVERGNMLSHTAITGRKFGIPTIVSVDNATKIIPNGAIIEMDAFTGTIKIINGKLGLK